MTQKSLKNQMPALWLIVGMTVMTMLGTRGWGLSDEGWPMSTFYTIGAIIGVICLLFETEAVQYRIWYIIPYSLIIWGVPGAVQWHLGSTNVTVNLLVIVIGLAGALPGIIIYMIMSAVFEKRAEKRFNAQNPEVHLRRQYILAKMDTDSAQSLVTLKGAIEKVVNSDQKQPEAQSSIMDFVNQNAPTRDDAERFYYMYDAVNKRDLVQDLIVLHGMNDADIHLEHLINIGFVEGVYPFEPRLSLTKETPALEEAGSGPAGN
jgi:phage shock protein PspC (stress-responsive transcriptional regulator)